MYVCICCAVTEEQILQVVKEGKTDYASVARATGVSMGCGTCGPMAAHVIDSLVRQVERSKDNATLHYPAVTTKSANSTSPTPSA